MGGPARRRLRGGGPHPLPSPDGSLTLHTHGERGRADPRSHQCGVIEIRDTEGRLVHAENTRASARMRCHFEWESDDRVRMVSGDIGTRHWWRTGGRWVREEAGAEAGTTPD